MNQVILFLAQLDKPPDHHQAGAEAVQNIINTVLVIVGILAVVFLLVGAFRYVISGGDPQKVSQAKDTILYALIGAVVAASAFAIVNFLFSEIGSNLQESQDIRQEAESSLLPSATVVYAQSAENLCPEGVQGETCTPGSSLNDIAYTVVNVLSLIIGAVAVVMIIIGGLRYVISGGDQQAVAGAKNTILYAIIGLVIAIFAQVIVQFVLDAASGNLPETEQQEQENTEEAMLYPLKHI